MMVMCSFILILAFKRDADNEFLNKHQMRMGPLLPDNRLKLNIADRASKLPPLRPSSKSRKPSRASSRSRSENLSRLASKLQRESPYALLNERFDAYAWRGTHLNNSNKTAVS